MNAGLVVEGPTDEAVYRVLLREGKILLSFAVLAELYEVLS